MWCLKSIAVALSHFSVIFFFHLYLNNWLTWLFIQQPQLKSTVWCMQWRLMVYWEQHPLKCRRMHGLVIFHCSDLIVMFLLEVLVLGLHFGLQYSLNSPSFSGCHLLIHLNLIKTTRSDKNLDYFLFRMKRLQELLPHPKRKKNYMVFTQKTV